MDVRDIKSPMSIPLGSTIEAIYDLQQELLKKYLEIEKLSSYPYNLNLPAHQVIIKDFIARIVEELGEAYESYDKLLTLKADGKLNKETVIPALYNFNEELADALHFFVETLIVTDITPVFLKDWAINSNFPESMMGSLKFNNLYQSLVYGFSLTLDKTPEIREILEDSNDDFIRGGRLLSKYQASNWKIMAWDVIYPLQLARNTLKNKPWKQSQMISDTRMFKYYMAKAFQAFLGLTRVMGIDEGSLYTIYYKKNQINQFRIRSKY